VPEKAPLDSLAPTIGYPPLSMSSPPAAAAASFNINRAADAH
jgi:hypothetical protein